jgi:hypothetical protein
MTCAKQSQDIWPLRTRRNFGNTYIRLENPSTLSSSIRAASGYYTVSPVAGLSKHSVVGRERLASTRGHRLKILQNLVSSATSDGLPKIYYWLCWCADGWTYLLQTCKTL